MGKVETKAWAARKRATHEIVVSLFQPPLQGHYELTPLVSRAEFAADVAGRIERILDRMGDPGRLADLRALAAQIRKESE